MTQKRLQVVPEPSIILWDIEATSLNADFGHLLCVGWKRLGEKKVNIIRLDDYPSFKRDKQNDKRVAFDTYTALSQASIWVTWYGVKFDVPFVNSRLLAHGFGPMPPIKHIDGWWVCRQNLKLSSNRLQSCSDFFDLDDKTPLSRKIWKRASKGDKEAIDEVVEHCEADVFVLEQAYLKLRPLMHNHPNRALLVSDITDKKGKPIAYCPICAAKNCMGVGPERPVKVARTQLYRCGKCGGWSQGPPKRDKNIFIR